MKILNEAEIESKSINSIWAKVEENENSIDNGIILVKSIGQNFDSILIVVNGETIVPVINKEGYNLKIKKDQCSGRGMEVSVDNLIPSNEIEIDDEKN